jgi:hypothetical protein
MRHRKWSRRDLLKTSTGLAAGVLFAQLAQSEDIKARYARIFKV